MSRQRKAPARGNETGPTATNQPTQAYSPQANDATRPGVTLPPESARTGSQPSDIAEKSAVDLHQQEVTPRENASLFEAEAHSNALESAARCTAYINSLKALLLVVKHLDEPLIEKDLEKVVELSRLAAARFGSILRRLAEGA